MTDVTTITRGWNAINIPDLTGKKFIITGGTSGLGKETARELIRKGAHVTITAREARKGEATVIELGTDRVSFSILDLTSLTSVKNFAQSVKEDFDVLILNAGVMATPLKTTEDGFELQFGTNHLGHFALAALLRKRVQERIVSVASLSLIHI